MVSPASAVTDFASQSRISLWNAFSLGRRHSLLPDGKKERTMEKKPSKARQKTTLLRLQTETLRRLDDARLQGVAGGGRLRVPVGYADNTTPIYDDADTTG
jgi:hypothetical protein